MDVEDPMTPIMAITPVTPTDINEPPTSEEQPNKRRRKKSIVWEHFTIETVGAGCMRARCKQCKKSFAYITGSKLAGTSHLKRHIALKICPASCHKNESSPCTPGMKTDPPKKRYRASPGFSSIPFDQDRCNHEIAKMIIQHDYPLHIVEHPAFIDFVRTLQPQFNMPSINTIQGECVDVYMRERHSLSSLLSGIPGRVNLTLDLAASDLDIGYAFLTGHFIDDDWNLQRRILNVAMLPFPDSDYAFNQAAMSCLSEWHLEGRLFTLTLDQSFSNETIIGNLRGLLSVKSPFVLHSQLVKGNCYARVLSRLAQDALTATGEIIRRIRDSVKYVKTSEAHDEKFAELRQQLQVPGTKDLTIDDQTKWNTTYQMLVAACELKEVFACLDTSDPVYKINPSIDDWKKADILCTYLKLLYEAANILTGPTYPPAHVFYHEVYKIQLELTHAALSQDPFVSSLTKPLKEKFDEYWKGCFLVLAIAVVMDPRFKMKLLEFSFPKVFGEDAGMWIKIVDDGIHELFLDYLAPNLHLSSTYVEEVHVGIPQSDAPQQVEVAPSQEGDSQRVPAEEVHPREVSIQVVHPGNATHQVVPLQDVHHQEIFPKELHPKELPSLAVQSQEMLAEAVPFQEVSPHGMHTEQHSKELPSQETHAQAQESHAEEAPSQKMKSEEFPSQRPPQEMDTTEVPPQEVCPQDTGAEEVTSQEVSIKEMHTEVVPPQVVHTKEMSAQEMNSEEVLPQEMQTEEVPHQEMQTEEVPPQEMHSKEEPAQEMHTEEVPAQGLHSEELPAQETRTEELPAQETRTEELPAQETRTEEVPAQETRTEEVPAQETRTEELPAQETRTEELPAQETRTGELPGQETRTGELPAQETHTGELPAQETHTEVLPAQETRTEVLPAQETRTGELPGQETYTEEVLAQETHTEEVPAQETHTEEVPAQETYTEEVLAQETYTEEVMRTEEVSAQGLQTEEVQLQVIHQEMQPQVLHTQDLPMLSIGDGLSDFDIYISEITGQHLKSELDRYLEESLLPRVHEFDVLGWWKLNRLKYPILSKMAADILSIPVSTVGPDSVFDTEAKRVDNYRSSLRPVILEALVCAKDWLQYGFSGGS